ncbi:hypothetical protein DFH06DRAFT_1307023 [Mycena polygramma]|nr:hypothetical protein DFH06DRAFT_1307023 [Mycena polygramma]
MQNIDDALLTLELLKPVAADATAGDTIVDVEVALCWMCQDLARCMARVHFQGATGLKVAFVGFWVATSHRLPPQDGLALSPMTSSALELVRYMAQCLFELVSYISGTSNSGCLYPGLPIVESSDFILVASSSHPAD